MFTSVVNSTVAALNKALQLILGQTPFRSAVVTITKTSLSFLPLSARLRVVIALSYIPPWIQQAALKVIKSPCGSQLRHIVRVKKDTWQGDWIVQNVQRHKHPLEWTENSVQQADMVLLYFHGGAFHIGTSTIFMPAFLQILENFREHNKMKDVRILSVDYTLVPHATYPVALEECSFAYLYLIHDLGVSSSRIIIAGDSAGGNLAAAMLLKIRDQQLRDEALAHMTPLPAGAALISPWVNLNEESMAIPYAIGTDYVRKWHVLHFIPAYFPHQLDGMDAQTKRTILTDPYISPIYGNFGGSKKDSSSLSFCHLLVAYGGGEALKFQIRQFIEKIREQHPDTPLYIITRDNMPHIWMMDHAVNPSKEVWLEDLRKLTDWCTNIISH